MDTPVECNTRSYAENPTLTEAELAVFDSAMNVMVKPIKQRSLGLALALLMGMALLAPALASGEQRYGYVMLAAATSKSAAAEKARAMYGGKVLKVEEVSNGSGKVYRVKLLLEGGRIKIVTIDASNGRVT